MSTLRKIYLVAVIFFLDKVFSFNYILRNGPVSSPCHFNMMSETNTQVSRYTVISSAALGTLGLLTATRAFAIDEKYKTSACPSTGNCVSTASFKVLEKFVSPWDFSPNQPSEAFDLLVKEAGKNSLFTVIEVDRDNFYVRCEAKSAVPPDGIDDIEFVLHPTDGLVTFSAKSRRNVFVGPVAVSDGNAARNRLETLRKRLGWSNINDRLETYTSIPTKRRSYFDSLKGVKSSYGEDDQEDTLDY